MRVILGILVWLLTFLLLGIPLALLSLYRWLIILIYSGRRIRSEGASVDTDDEGVTAKLQSIPVADCMFAPGSSWEKPIINFGFLLKLQRNDKGEGISIHELRDHFSKCFLSDQMEGGRYDKFCSYLTIRGGHGFRATKKVISLEDHILEVTLDDDKMDQQGKRISLEEFLAQWVLTGYKVEKPCWEINLIWVEGSQFLAFKIHHVQADGYSVLHILDKLTNNTSPYLVKDFPEGVFGHLKQLLEGPINLGRFGGTPPDKNPFAVKLGPKHEWMMSFTSFPLDKLKEVRRKHGVFLQSVVWTIISGALREFLEMENEGKEIPEHVKVAATAPWPRHPSRDERVSNKDKMCNSWVTIPITLPLRNPEPISRMKEIDSDIISCKKSGLEKFAKQVMFPVMAMMPSTVMTGAMAGKDPGFAAGLTQLVGGDNYSLLGCGVEEIHPILAVHDSSPFISQSTFTFSHSGKMEFSFGAHPSVFKDQETLNNFCHKLCHKQFDLIVAKSNE